MEYRVSPAGPGRLAVLLVLGIASALGVSAAQGTGQPPRESALGRLVGCEPVARLVTLQTGNGKLTFVLAEDAMLREGVRSIEVERIGALLGRTAKIRYETVRERRIARQLTVATATVGRVPGRPRPPAPDERE